MNPVVDYFELFGLPVRFDLDLGELERAYRNVQGRVHPDRFASASEAERRVAMQRATQANEAYRTLKHPLERARHILALRGAHADPEARASMPSEFLARQLEWREAMEEARAAKNISALETLRDELRRERREHYAHLEDLLRSGADLSATEAVWKLMFIEKMDADIGDGIEALEAG